MRKWSPAPLLLLALSGCASPREGKPPAPNESSALFEPRLRRLSNREIERAVATVLGEKVELAFFLPPDVRQEGYTVNARQEIASEWASQYEAQVARLVASADRREKSRPRCDFGAETCVRESVKSLGERAFRRPLDAEESSSLERLVLSTPPPERFARLLTTLLVSPSFLYLREFGAATKSNEIRKDATMLRRLDAYELASALAFAVTGAPPDETLLEKARDGSLASREVRRREARRLLGKSETRHHVRQFVLEWLEVDQLENTAKDPNLFPEYPKLRASMLEETKNFVDEVMVHHGGKLATLLDAGFSSVDQRMARFYGLSTYGNEASLAKTTRRGILQHASFLAAHAHEDVPSPVKRGDFVLRKLFCERIARPAEIGLEVVMPAPTKKMTTRERFANHASDENCAMCHRDMDAIGFLFEGFDAGGRARTSEFSFPVVTKANFEAKDRAYSFADSGELSRELARSGPVAECLTRHVFRFLSGALDPEVEETFLREWRSHEESDKESLLFSIALYAESDVLLYRRIRE